MRNKRKFWALSVSHTRDQCSKHNTCWWFILLILFFSAGSPAQLPLLQMSSSQSKMTVGINCHSCAPYCPKRIIFNWRVLCGSCTSADCVSGVPATSERFDGFLQEVEWLQDRLWQPGGWILARWEDVKYTWIIDRAVRAAWKKSCYVMTH